MRYINACVITNNEKNEILNNAEVEVVGNKIVYVGKVRDCNSPAIDCANMIISAGFVNTHCHSSMTLFRNVGGVCDFNNWWYDHIRPLEAVITMQDYEIGTKLAILEMLKNGITTVLDFYFYPENLAKIYHEYGMRAVVGVGSPKDGMILTDEEIDIKYKGVQQYAPLVTPCVLAHSVYAIDPDNIVSLSNYAKKHNSVFTIHASETLNEVGECDKNYGYSPIGLLESLGVLENKCILAHCVHCDKDDMEILSRCKDVYVSTNPSSNLVLCSGIAPLSAYYNRGIKIVLGTDGVASNDSLSILKEMFLATNLQNGTMCQSQGYDYAQAYRSATIVGAQSLDLKNIGRVEEGCIADLVFIKRGVNMQPDNDTLRCIVNSMDSSNIYATMVDGKVLYENGKYNLDIDVDNLVQQATKSIYRIKNANKL